jgi:cyclohexa-1,5-dienecarbonyl-CoA hydratase
MIETFHGIFRLMDTLEAPSIALVKGAALGGGCELALYCDMVLASEKAKFGQPEIKVGVFPPIAALAFPRLTARKKALELILLGEIIDAPEALRLGLINQVIPLESFDGEAEKFVGKLTALSGLVLKMAKKATLRGLRDDVDAALRDIEKIYLEELMKTQDAKEGLKAFLEKRNAVWTES